MNNGMVFIFYRDLEKIGYIITKKKNITIHNNKKDIIEVSFLCLLKKYRNLHITPYIVNIIVKESILRYNISINIYSISSSINSIPYCIKNLYHRPIKINNLIQNKFLIEKDNYSSFEKFNKSKYTVVYYNNKIPNVTTLYKIFTKLKKFKKNNFKMFENITMKELIKLFNNDSFEHFLFYDKNDNIIDYICNYIITIKTEFGTYNNSILYHFFIEDYTLNNINKAIESICEFHSINDIVDVFSFHDIFNTNNYLLDLNCLKGEGNTNYFIFNYKMYTIKNSQNSIVHI